MEMNQLQNSLIYGKVMWFERGFSLRDFGWTLELRPLRGWSAWEPIMVQ